MNNTRRKEIKKVVAALEELNATIQRLQDEEDDAMMAIEEKFGDTERYEKMEECYDAMGDAIQAIEEAVEYLEDCL